MMPLVFMTPKRGAAPIVPVGSHRYWRLNIASAYGVHNPASPGPANYFCNINALQMFETAGGGNVCSGGTPFSTTVYGANAVGRAFDTDWSLVCSLSPGGAVADPWTSGTVCIGYDFGSSNDKEITAVSLMSDISASAQDGGAFTYQAAPEDFDVQYSDNNSTWTTAWSVTGDAEPWHRNEARLFVNPSYTYSGSFWGAHAYWRTTFARSSGNEQCAEVDYRATPGGADQATGGTVTGSSQFNGTLSIAAGMDNNAASKWVRASAGTYPHFLSYAFTGAVSVAQLMLQASPDSGGAGEMPPDGTIFFSDDGTNWYPAFSFRNQTTWSTGEVRGLTDPYYV